jgi:DNA-binding response OmpR family regulator
MHILVVEDNPLIRSATQCLLEEWGFVVECAGSVAEAVNSLDGRFSHLLCDLNLPDGTGTEVIREAKRVKRSIRAVAMTGNAALSLQNDGQMAGADWVLTKPAAMRDLRFALQS